jgi:hypothetical protein
MKLSKLDNSNINITKEREMMTKNGKSEVKKEIQRIKIKNKNLEIARSKREQQLKTMNKL